jgi:hypothetical protein
MDESTIHPEDPDLATGTRGAISELVVSADLLRRNLPTFRALSPSCPCDLVVLHQGRALRIEVRTAIQQQSGMIQFPLAGREKGRFDVLAAVCDDEVYYFPNPFGDAPTAVSPCRGAHLKLVAWGLLDGPVPPPPPPPPQKRTITYKLTEEAVREVRRDLARGRTKTAIAHQHGVSWQTIHHIAIGKARVDVAG